MNRHPQLGHRVGSSMPRIWTLAIRLSMTRSDASPTPSPRRSRANLDLDGRVAHVTAVETQRRHEEVDPALDASVVVEEDHSRERGVVIERRNARPAADRL